MVASSIQILCSGDLHLGRHPSRIPDRLDGPECSPRSVWLDIVREAIDRDVDAVVLTGDIADRENQYFEAYGAFEAGVIELDEAGIPVVTVAGNHDSEFLPRMVADIDLDNLRLLGEGGSWDRWTLERDGDDAIHFNGWSFPQQHVSSSPLKSYELPETGETPQIGVVHTELDSPRSEYAPVMSTELETTPVDCWLLGHIHTPGIQNESDPVSLYPGSPQGLDPGERGAHGPWLLSLEPDGTVTPEQIPLATICYDTVSVDVSECSDTKGVAATVSSSVQEHVEENFETANMSAFLPRVTLTGRTEAHAEIVDEQYELAEKVTTKHGSIDIHVESVEVTTRPDIDLEAKADGEGPIAYLAELVLAFETDDPGEEYNDVLESAHGALERAHNGNAFTVLKQERDFESPGREDAIEYVEQEARMLLDTLIRQKEGQT